jgi:hypothetical protein
MRYVRGDGAGDHAIRLWHSWLEPAGVEEGVRRLARRVARQLTRSAGRARMDRAIRGMASRYEMKREGP